MTSYTYDPTDDVVTVESPDGDVTTVRVEYGADHDVPYSDWDDRQREANPYTIVVTTATRAEPIRLGYWVGILASEPTALDVLACLVSDGEMVGWATDPIELDDAYQAETGESLSVRQATRWAAQNAALVDALGHLDSFEIGGE